MAWMTLLPAQDVTFSSSKKDQLVPLSMTGIKGFKAQKVILRCNQLPKMQVDAQLGAQLQHR